MHNNKNFLSVLLISVLLFSSAVAMRRVEATLQGKILNPTADAWIDEEYPDGNVGRTSELRAALFEAMEGFREILAFLMFDLKGVPAGAALEQATLRLYTHAVNIKAVVGVYYSSSNDWTEDGITYNSKPVFDPSPVDSANVTTKNIWYEWNVTNTARSAMEKTDRRLSLVLKADSFGDVLFRSRQAPSATYFPQLDVVYEPPPQTDNTIPTDAIVIAVIAAAAATIGLVIGYKTMKRRSPPNTMKQRQLAFATNFPQQKH